MTSPSREAFEAWADARDATHAGKLRSEVAGFDYPLGRVLDCVRPDAVAALQRKVWAENSDLVKDAERYRALREQHWASSQLFVVAGGKTRIKLGTDCPTHERLDYLTDQLLEKKNGHPLQQ